MIPMIDARKPSIMEALEPAIEKGMNRASPQNEMIQRQRVALSVNI
jgi:hypothetical protein